MLRSISSISILHFMYKVLLFIIFIVIIIIIITIILLLLLLSLSLLLLLLFYLLFLLVVFIFLYIVFVNSNRVLSLASRNVVDNILYCPKTKSKLSELWIPFYILMGHILNSICENTNKSRVSLSNLWCHNKLSKCIATQTE